MKGHILIKGQSVSLPMIPGYPKTSAALKKLMPKYRFSRAKWYEADLFNKGYRMDEVREWCVEQFGPQDHNPDAWSRWTNSMNSTFRFRDQKDYQWFVLRWGA